MQCEICSKNPGEYQCQICRKIICENCAQTTKNGVFCPGCLPESKKTEYSGNPGLRYLFLTLLLLTIGLSAFIFFADSLISGYNMPNTGIQQLINTLKTSGLFITCGMALLTAVTGITYFVLRKKK